MSFTFRVVSGELSLRQLAIKQNFPQLPIPSFETNKETVKTHPIFLFTASKTVSGMLMVKTSMKLRAIDELADQKEKRERTCERRRWFRLSNMMVSWEEGDRGSLCVCSINSL